MLPVVAIFLAVTYLVLDFSGVIDDFAEGMARRSGRSVRWRRQPRPRERPKANSDKRLEVFQRFIDNLSASDEEEE